MLRNLWHHNEHARSIRYVVHWTIRKPVWPRKECAIATILARFTCHHQRIENRTALTVVRKSPVGNTIRATPWWKRSYTSTDSWSLVVRISPLTVETERKRANLGRKLWLDMVGYHKRSDRFDFSSTFVQTLIINAYIIIITSMNNSWVNVLCRPVKRTGQSQWS